MSQFNSVLVTVKLFLLARVFVTWVNLVTGGLDDAPLSTGTAAPRHMAAGVARSDLGPGVEALVRGLAHTGGR